MKKLSFFLLSMVLLASCSQQDNAPDMPEEQKSSVSEPYTGVARDIWINVLSNRFGGYHKGQPNTRAEGAFTITPYIEEGDTLMYIVQYEQGWELYSASKANRMMIMASEKGEFDINNPDMPDAMRDIILLSCEQNRERQEYTSAEANLSWGATALAESRLSTGKVKVRQKNGTQSVVAYSDLPPGRWVLIETVTEVNDQYNSPKLIQTEWHQEYPWNKYAKRESSNGSWQSCPAGCVPIAVAQYMYYTHFKDNVPSSSVSSAILTSNGADYEFSNPTANLWNQMALSDNGNGNTDFAALLIGDVGRKLYANYTLDGTGVSTANSVSYLKSLYNTDIYFTSFDFSYVKSSLDKGYPTLCEIYRVGAGHEIIVDRYTRTTTVTTAYYGYEREPWTGPGDDPWPDNDYDEEGNIIGYGITNEVETKEITYNILMNWGWYPHSRYDEKTFIPDAENWHIDTRDYNQGHYIYKRADIN